MSDDFLNLLDGPTRPDTPQTTTTISRDATKYALAALEGECAKIRAVPIGSGRNHQLNTSAFKMGGLVAAGAIDAHTVTEALGAADGGLDYRDTRNTIRSGLESGMQQPRHIEDRTTSWQSRDPSESAAFATASPQSGDPFAPGYVAAPSTPADTTGAAPATPTSSARGEPAEATSAQRDALVRERLPVIDWFDLWTNPTDVEWIIEPLLPARRLVAIYSPPKVGKSLIMLELAYKVSRGVELWGTTPARAYKVLYVDFENDPQGDILPRLINMGAEPMHLDNLYYLSFPTIAKLDTERGAIELLAACHTYGAELIVIDTVSRSVGGDENENDTWLDFYRETGMRLKQANIAMIRLDHTGKDETKGQRGGSAKGGDVDAVWRLTRKTDDTFQLINEMTRFPIPAIDKVLTLVRREEPLRHDVNPRGASEALIEAVMAYCDTNDIDYHVGQNKLSQMVKAVGIDAGHITCKKALRIRRERAGIDEKPEKTRARADE